MAYLGMSGAIDSESAAAVAKGLLRQTDATAVAPHSTRTGNGRVFPRPMTCPPRGEERKARGCLRHDGDRAPRNVGH